MLASTFQLISIYIFIIIKKNIKMSSLNLFFVFVLYAQTKHEPMLAT